MTEDGRQKKYHERGKIGKTPQLNTLRCHFVDSTGQAKRISIEQRAKGME
jgi:hypothetical protein